MREFNKLRHPSSKIRYRFPSAAAKSHRDFALTVNHSRAALRSIARYAHTTATRVLAMEKTFVQHDRANHLAEISLGTCGCCLYTGKFTSRIRIFTPVITAWACCVMIWLTLTSVLLTVKAASLPAFCFNSSSPDIYANHK